MVVKQSRIFTDLKQLRFRSSSLLRSRFLIANFSFYRLLIIVTAFRLSFHCHRYQNLRSFFFTNMFLAETQKLPTLSKRPSPHTLLYVQNKHFLERFSKFESFSLSSSLGRMAVRCTRSMRIVPLLHSLTGKNCRDKVRRAGELKYTTTVSFSSINLIKMGQTFSSLMRMITGEC